MEGLLAVVVYTPCTGLLPGVDAGAKAWDMILQTISTVLCGLTFCCAADGELGATFDFAIHIENYQASKKFVEGPWLLQSINVLSITNLCVCPSLHVLHGESSARFQRPTCK
jgi:hypothetical protein